MRRIIRLLTNVTVTLVGIALSPSVTQAQDTASTGSIALTTSDGQENWELLIEPATEDASVWVDFNGNGKKDGGENYSEYNDVQIIPVTSKTITIYGDIMSLEASKCGLTSIAFSNCNSLQNLTLSSNNLSVIDLSKLPALESFWAQNNQLTNLDVSKNENLSDIDCSENLISEITFATNALVSSLTLFENKLTTFSTEGLSELMSLSIRNNELTSLVFGESEYLESVECSNNKLTSLDLSPLEGVLSELYAKNNQLSEIDLSNFTNLRTISVSQNQLIEAKFPQSAMFIDCYQNKLSAITVSNIIRGLKTKEGEVKTKITIIDSESSAEKNILTQQHIDDAKAKGWLVYDWKGGKNNGNNDAAPFGKPDILDPIIPADNTLPYVTLISEKGSGNWTGELMTEIIANPDVSAQGWWIDKNNNGIKDDGELVKKGNMDISNIPITSKVMTIYGAFRMFVLPNNELIKVNIQNPHITTFNVARNHLKEIDLTNCDKLHYLQLQSNQLEQIKLKPNTPIVSIAIDQNKLNHKAIAELFQALPDRNKPVGGAEIEAGEVIVKRVADAPRPDPNNPGSTIGVLKECPKEIEGNEIHEWWVKYIQQKNYTVSVTLYIGEDDDPEVYILENVYPGTNVSVEQIHNTQIAIYPNPATEYICIDLIGWEQSCFARLYSLDGLLQLQTVLTPGQNRIELGQLPNGTYILETVFDVYKLSIAH